MLNLNNAFSPALGSSEEPFCLNRSSVYEAGFESSHGV